MDSPESNACEFLWKIGSLLSLSCPAASRYYLSSLERYLAFDSKALKIGPKRAHLFCQYCGLVFGTNKSLLRIQPCPFLNKHMIKLFKLQAEEPWKLNSRQKKKIKKFEESTNKIVYSCLVCKKKTFFQGDKKCNSRNKLRSSSSTTVLKVKLKKKGDLHAGLFISSPTDRGKPTDTEDNTPGINAVKTTIDTVGDSPAGNTRTLPKTSRDLEANPFSKHKNYGFKSQKTPITEKSKVSFTEKQSSKKKKSLLGEIMKREQEKDLKAKPGLASFLVSL